MKKIQPAALILLALSLVGCGGSSTSQTLAGSWVGTFQYQTVGLTNNADFICVEIFQVSEDQTTGSVSGTVTVCGVETDQQTQARTTILRSKDTSGSQTGNAIKLAYVPYVTVIESSLVNNYCHAQVLNRIGVWLGIAWQEVANEHAKILEQQPLCFVCYGIKYHR